MLFWSMTIVQNALSSLCQATLLDHIECVHLDPLLFDERITSIFASQHPEIELSV